MPFRCESIHLSCAVNSTSQSTTVHLVSIHGDLHAAAAAGDPGVHPVVLPHDLLQVLLQLPHELDAAAVLHVSAVQQSVHPQAFGAPLCSTCTAPGRYGHTAATVTQVQLVDALLLKLDLISAPSRIHVVSWRYHLAPDMLSRAHAPVNLGRGFWFQDVIKT